MPDQENSPTTDEATPSGSADARGRLSSARWCPSPNFNDRPQGSIVSLIVVHNISLPPGKFGGPEVEHFFCNSLDPAGDEYLQSIASMKVSAHVLIRRDGELVQFVDFAKRAWHAGRSSFEGVVECNDYGIGIELEGTDDQPFEAAQYQKLAEVCAHLIAQWPGITADRITGHSDIAPGRKTDPGPAFDWVLFRRLLDRTLERAQ